MRTYIGQLFNVFINWIFPPRYDIRELEAMKPADFFEVVSRSVDDLPQGIVSLFKYRDPLMRKALWALKYDGNRKIATLFATLLADMLVETLSDALLFENAERPIIIPIPLSRERLRERGWNQSELIVKELIKHCPQCELRNDILIKTRHTLPQTKLHRNQRLENLRGCFEVPKQSRTYLTGRFVIVIDDVTTTGATLLEARRALLESGARHVIAFTVAH